MKEFLTKYSITTHSIAALFATLVLAYASVPAFHDLVLNVYNLVPAGVQSLILAALGLYTWYRNGESPAPAKSWYQQQKAKGKI